MNGVAVFFFRIKNWAEFFERGHRADREVVFRWVAVPTKHDGKGYRRLCKHSKAVSVFCAFVLMVETAAKMPVRGELRDENGPLTAKDLSDSTGFPAQIFENAFDVLTDESAGVCWLEKVPFDVLSRQVPTSPATGQDRTEENKNARAHSGNGRKNGHKSGFTSAGIAKTKAALKGVLQP